MRKIKFLLCFILVIGTGSHLFAQKETPVSDIILDENNNIRYFKVSGMARAGKSDYTEVKALLTTTLKTNEQADFRLISLTETTKGKAKMLFQHYYKGVPVYDNYYNVHLADGIPAFCNGRFANITRTANTAGIQLNTAIAIGVAKSTYNKAVAATSKKGELILFRIKDTDPYRYVYKVEVIYPNATKSKELMIDAATGDVLISSDIVCSVNTPGTGDTRYSGTRNITGDSFAGGFRLREDNSGVAVNTLNNQNSAVVNAIDFVDTDNNLWTAAEHGNNRQALDVHWATERFLDYFRTNFGRNGFDNNNFRVTNYVHRFDSDNMGNTFPMDNAFWDPNDRTLSYGDGFFLFQPLTSVDIVGHEMGHGFAFFEVGFNNTGEARSLNEGFSDVWGAVIESAAEPAKNRWLNGEEIMANGFSCLRSLRAPNTEGFRFNFFTEGNYPDTRLGNFWDVNNADPHINATVLGHWFFRLSEGGTGATDFGNAFNIAGVGIQTAAQIAYNTELVLTPSADFNEVRIASIQYATNQWGAHSCQTIAVTNAWFAVGVGPAYSGNLNLSIAGDNSFCTTSNNYTINGLPGGATVQWSVFPTGTVTINSPNATQTTLTRNSNGPVTLTALVNVCGMQISISKTTIIAGPPIVYSGFYTYTNYPYGMPMGLVESWGGEDNEVCYTVRPTTMTTNMDIRGATSVVWQPDFAPPGLLWGQTGHNLNISFRNPNQLYEFVLTASNACGTTEKYYIFRSLNCSNRLTGKPPAPVEEQGFNLFPNPATNNVAITANKVQGLPLGTTVEKPITEVRVYDVSGRLKIMQRYSRVMSASISTSDLQNGVYFVEIYSGNDKEVKNLKIIR